MTYYVVLLDNGTVGTIDTDTLQGQHPEAFMDEEVKVHLYDENGFPMEAEGRLIEVLGEA